MYTLYDNSGGHVTSIKKRSYHISVTGKSNSLLLINYPLFPVTACLPLLVTAILNVEVVTSYHKK
jgi:hypothetical protein